MQISIVYTRIYLQTPFARMAMAQAMTQHQNDERQLSGLQCDPRGPSRKRVRYYINLAATYSEQAVVCKYLQTVKYTKLKWLPSYFPRRKACCDAVARSTVVHQCGEG